MTKRTMTKLLLGSTIASILCLSSALPARAQESQSTSANQSSTATAETSTAAATSRTVESHVQSDNRTVDTSRVEVLDPNGRYVPNFETEKEIVQVDATTTRTIERLYNWDTNGQRSLVRVTEEEARTSATGANHVVRTTSNSDGYGSLQVTQREVADTTKTGPKTQETQTTLYLPSGNGGLVPSWKTQEVQTRTGEHTVDVKKTTLRQYSTGGSWQVDAVTDSTIKENGKDRTTEQRVSRSDLNGQLSEVSHTVDNQTETAGGEKKHSVETYSTQVPGSSPDGDLHLTTRVTTTQKNEPGGQMIEEKLEQANAFDAYAAPQVVRKTQYTVQYAATGTQQTKTVEVRDLNGNWNVTAFGTKSSIEVPAQPVQAKPPAQPQ